ncbi:alkaline phosphatase family protein [Robiginitalea sp. M366]|uniref:alkaline phosphatase family protein n=1 Tax=Robiginitalea aestuariiviva TaxID=3036903 RepID=UPI00240E0A2A|nr:nucleotide pyrophosphatase/phosphodiesterase family protein [Robiginitalea aestuariiviva]MDG1572616.1 alkaline phosphatase family protein [Robiginitalea aestuariiviva]
MKKTVVINVVGLTRRLLGPHMPRITAFAERGGMQDIHPVLPAVTCTAQSTYLTGTWPEDHGIVGNGWYFNEELEVKFWRQSNRLVQGDKIWDALRRENPGFTCANMFWWYNMYSSVDFSVTPRPNYLADGRKIPDVYSHPAGLRDRLQEELGTFPLFHFWGPKTSIRSTEWIANASMLTDRWHNPTLTLIYLPHLDYNLQRHGLDMDRIATDLQEVDRVTGNLIDYYSGQGARVVLLSEYGITNVHRPVHLNRVLRAAELLAVRVERGLELLDAGASEAFAVADHQVAHIYVKDPARIPEVQALLASLPGVERLLVGEERSAAHLGHARCGDLVAVADADSWFTYYYWEDDARAPDFARTVDIHRKPGYDPVELFTDPDDAWVMPRVVGKLLRKKLGFRTLMNIIPLKPELVKGSHGRIPDDPLDYPIFISDNPVFQNPDPMQATEVYSCLKRLLEAE